MSMRHNPVSQSRSRPQAMQLTALNIGIAAAGGMVFLGYVVFILIPACTSYGRLWERVAAGFLSLFMLVALLGIGLAIGFSLVYFYDGYS